MQRKYISYTCMIIPKFVMNRKLEAFNDVLYKRYLSKRKFI